MERSGVLSEKHAVDLLFYMWDEPKFLNQLERFFSDEYLMRKVMTGLIQEGYVKRFGTPGTKGVRYGLTDKGYKFVEENMPDEPHIDYGGPS